MHSALLIDFSKCCFTATVNFAKRAPDNNLVDLVRSLAKPKFIPFFVSFPTLNFFSWAFCGQYYFRSVTQDLCDAYEYSPTEAQHQE